MKKQPVAPAIITICPEFIDGPEGFDALPAVVRRYVLDHWLWCIRVGEIHGPGLVSHYNWVQWDLAESAAGAKLVHGATFNGDGVKRDDW